MIFDGPTEEGVGRYLSENLVTQDNGVPIAELPRPFAGLDGKLKMVDLRIAAIEDDSREPFAAHRFLVKVTVEVKESSEPFMIGLTVFADDESPVGNTFSPSISDLQIGREHELEFEMQVPLAPGTITVAFRFATSALQRESFTILF